LSIVKKIVDYYGGEVYIDPACHQGTAIIVTLPLPPA
jgi:signal transduction histidine kinase